MDTMNQGPAEGRDHTSFSFSKKGTHTFQVLLVMIIGIAAAVAVVLLSLNARLDEDGLNASTVVQSNATDTRLSMASSAGKYRVGEAFDVSIILTSSEGSIMGSDILLEYDPLVLDVEPVDSKARDAVGKYLRTDESVFDSFLGYENRKGEGLVIFSALKNPGEKFSGGGKIANVRFKALRAGLTEVKFKFEPKVTTDTNVAVESGKDSLDEVSGLRLLVE